ncbi:MAG: ATP-binding cassette domain-containing protein, partial [Spirochaetaceae bacterium]|nr:ATP-binding cassette domain-containing protein [Spirochaetaceae bacterium]
ADRRRRGEGLAGMFQLTRLLERKPATLSGGEQQRVALARSLAAGPELLLLDEPLSSLDASLRRELRGEIRERVREAGLTALHVTHDLEEALALADRLFVMREGRLVEAGRPEELYAAPRRAYTARFLGRGPLLEARDHAVHEGLATAETAFGRLACPLGASSPVASSPAGARAALATAAEGQAAALPEGCDARHRAEDKRYFHFAAADPRPLSAGESAPDNANLLEGRVLATSFLGRARRILLEPMGAADADRQGGAAPIGIEIEVEPSFHPRRGERLRLAIPIERCMLIGD